MIAHMKRTFEIALNITILLLLILWLTDDDGYEAAIGIAALILNASIQLWPKSDRYKDTKIKGTATFNYSNNNGVYTVGKVPFRFDTKWSKASGESIHVYNDKRTIDKLAISADNNCLRNLPDLETIDFSSRLRTPSEGQTVVFVNQTGNILVARIDDIKDSSREDDRDEITITYKIYAQKKQSN
jgi:hypothetical protein